jgi:hypothetical protein
VTIAIASVLAAFAIVLVARRRRRELFNAPHVHELDHAMIARRRRFTARPF